jgi:hypothetical protein
VNTPQFDWSRSKLTGRPRPLPPVFQPEVAARAILYAARRAPRELKVGLPVAGTIWLNKFLPAAVDRFLARTACSGQEEPVLISGQRPDNLFEPVNWNVGAHGRFDHEAIDRARGLDVRVAARAVTRTAAAAAGVVCGAVILKRLGDAVAP